MNTATAITIAALAALTPTVTCLIGIILSRQDNRDTRAELRGEIAGVRGEILGLGGEILALRNHVDTSLGHIRDDLKQFYGMTTKLEGRMDEPSKR